ncbi:arf-GAP with coiled-coil, ANK repeat and PH domain-containing protein 1 [Platysternon megacephalum]|uniref:Arf-GAP with coiled-coil, ANK repeat and PH domain-containing protein 1 n=1 Tax=Platysternon megacephalum TaxID=55544 RepID=A0A4D9DJS0_9SAUR|nr:arf-GAP with coiled-coil, ANK repeat and PH domain-containing protein 1 [Platysternon megacephalum]
MVLAAFRRATLCHSRLYGLSFRLEPLRLYGPHFRFVGGDSMILRPLSATVSPARPGGPRLLSMVFTSYFRATFSAASPELTGLRHRVAFLDKELAKAQKALGKSKKAQEVEALLSENEMLQGKLHSQEEDFRLQNSTLLQELSKLCSQIEQLETDNKRMQGGGPAPDGPPPPGPPGEFLRLQAENTALQKNVAALQERLEKEVARQAGGQGGAPQAAGPAGEAVAGPTLELKWATEREEKKLLTEQLQGLEVSGGPQGVGPGLGAPLGLTPCEEVGPVC